MEPQKLTINYFMYRLSTDHAQKQPHQREPVLTEWAIDALEIGVSPIYDTTSL